LSLQERIDFVLNGLIYTSRCERFHGDYFSPTKSPTKDDIEPIIIMGLYHHRDLIGSFNAFIKAT